MFQRCVQYASNRLRLQELLSRYPEILDVHVQRPIIVVGPPRSGTTQLVNLLAAHSELRSLRYWERDEPAPVSSETGPGATDLRRARTAKRHERIRSLLPHLPAMQPWDPDDVYEEFWLQDSDFASCVWAWTADVRPWPGHQVGQYHRPHYDYMKTVLKALQWQRGPQRWVLKSPEHAENIGPLISTFPDATIVMCHRNPVSVVQSFATFSAYRARVDYHDIDIDSVMTYCIDRIRHLLHTSVRDRNLIPQDRLIDVPFLDFMRSQIRTALRICTAAELKVSDKQRHRLERYVADRPRGRHGQISYNLRADFGVNPALLHDQFLFYRENFPLMTQT
ncbi:sulfotransferase family protein [Amycolatopsis alkalitolerans]|nr:sulfotransferase [Amycolatopsis alkalitolerans]